ncbi:MAG TPA: hypothetical protein VN718_03675 [Rhizomicrobium sp.]|nr:hypothetical protein [Rhizomicrobium sp.]
MTVDPSGSAVSEWSRCRRYIEAALVHSPGLETIADVERAIERGSYQVWFGKACCAVTEIAQYARAKALVVVHGGGNLRELLNELEPAMCEFARAEGCTLMMGTGRKGWERATRAHGYRFGFITMVKSLQPASLSWPTECGPSS